MTAATRIEYCGNLQVHHPIKPPKRVCGCLSDERCWYCDPCKATRGCFRIDRHKSKCAVRG